MENEALNRISSDSGTSSFECEMERAPERPPRGIRTSCGKSIVHMRLLQFERLCQENREELPKCSKSPRPPKRELPQLPKEVEAHEEESHEDENIPSDDVSHQYEEIAQEALEEEEEAKEGSVGNRDSNLSVAQSTDNTPTHPSKCDSSDFEEDDEVEEASPLPVIEVKNTEIYEDISQQYEQDYDGYSDSTFDSSDSEDDDNYLQVPQQVRPTSQDSISTRVVLLADELIKTEETYVDVLRRGIEGYTKVFKGELPMSLRGRENIIFGNLRRIFEFHAETLLPSLRDCFGDVEKIARVFMKYISEEYFYCYVLYAMNCSRAKKICEDHESFFAKSMEEVGDRLGILSLLLQPIQRIPRYKLLLENILEELGKNIERSAEVKSQLAETSRAWKAVTKLADCINSSMNVMDITECFEINLTHQGKFRDFEAFEFHDNDAGRRFRGHVFLFEKCIVYTENKGPDNKPTYLYRGHYAFAKLGILQDVNRGKISLFRDRLGQKQLDIYGPSPAISKWSDHITHVLMEFANEEKLKNSRGRVNRQSYKSVVPEFRNSTRGSIMSNLSIASSSSGYRSSQSSRDLDLDSRRTTWYENKNLQRLLNSEKHYVSMLYTYKKKLVDHLPEDVRQNIGGYIQCLEAICEMHRDRFLPKLRECDMDVEEICNLFNDFISDGSLGIYMTYATELMSVQQTLLDYNTQTALMSEDVEAGIKVFLQLPIKRLSAYEAAIHFILECFFSEGINTMSSIFKVAAVLEAELNNLTKSVENNAKVFTCSDFRMNRRSVGFVRYADNVAARAFGTWNYCVLLMERQVVCCKVKQDQESSYFTSVLFHTSYDNLLLRESKLNANRLKFCIKTGDQAVYPLIFRTQDKKQLFMRKFTEFYRHSVTSRK
ncbi:triple functional domain protein isoform X2 [Lutzomyia longipalpis]|uniref:triple functional domain protein isoform X2 n=1 Tax=Lutzomyia longipalpis TaxID=7200 RepID=UPI002483EA31|nr:triple functional domain protein isoform X2 [Lutzomyia longipalpis]